MNANFNPNGKLNVNWNLSPANHNPNLGGRSEVESCTNTAWGIGEIFSILQAFCLFLEGYFQVRDIFYFQLHLYLSQVLLKLLIYQVLQ